MAEKDMWCAVIQQAFKDATLKRFEHDTQERDRERQHARSWLLGDSKSFRSVCDMAGIEPQVMTAKARELAATGWPSMRGVTASGSALA